MTGLIPGECCKDPPADFRLYSSGFTNSSNKADKGHLIPV